MRRPGRSTLKPAIPARIGNRGQLELAMISGRFKGQFKQRARARSPQCESTPKGFAGDALDGRLHFKGDEHDVMTGQGHLMMRQLAPNVLVLEQ